MQRVARVCQRQLSYLFSYRHCAQSIALRYIFRLIRGNFDGFSPHRGDTDLVEARSFTGIGQAGSIKRRTCHVTDVLSS